ncbi:MULTISPECIES: thioredoxin domain-containing protein [Burkholderia]|uniref:Thiol:disulfide interchange protein DsbA n=2 Tax=Burkholderia cepacia complex TaxID=87882 RepID=A0AAP1YDK2_9BURK|nr:MULTISPECIES: hypothetical protein [Burkholderia]MBK1901937.1 hypothetical protein [Burkholderia contaminans]MBK1910220.1 hypothetical protein [Burkholderia contaminans]MBK1923679.1 hypothetical protein [Burkholderia contaminans]MBK1931891.1 hypothetical protein [Burkholderia contaminans]MBK1939140.1 hypothetical protein [Burkholderia contaminans]
MSQWTKGWRVSVLSATVGALVAAGAAVWSHPQDSYGRTETGYDVARATNISKPILTEVGRGAVSEFFYFGCQYCRSFEPLLEAWQASEGRATQLNRVPVTGGRADLTKQATLFYALDSVGAVPRVQEAAFEVIARRPDFPSSDRELATWAAMLGIDPQRLIAEYHAPGMQARIDAGDRAFRAMGFATVPSVAINGRFVVTSSTSGGIEKMPQAMTRALSDGALQGS